MKSSIILGLFFVSICSLLTGQAFAASELPPGMSAAQAKQYMAMQKAKAIQTAINRKLDHIDCVVQASNLADEAKGLRNGARHAMIQGIDSTPFTRQAEQKEEESSEKLRSCSEMIH